MSEVTARKTIKDNGSVEQSVRKEWEENGITKVVEVRKVKGGYIVRKSKYGRPKDDENAEYVEETSEEVTTKDPFAEKEEDDKMFGFVDFPTIE